MFVKCLLLLFVLSFVDADHYYRYYRPTGSACVVPRIPHGRVRPKQRGSFIKYICSPGYTLVGNKYATCRAGRWDEPIPVCVKSGCPPLEEVKNAVTIPSHNNAWVVYFCLPGHQLVGSPALYCDGSQWNATVPGCYDTSAKVSTFCDFEDSNVCGWKRDDLHDFDWRWWSNRTPSSFLQTGPTYDHTFGANGTGHYMYIESTGAVPNDTARLLSPVYDATVAKDGCFVFYYHMFGRSMGGLRVYQKPDSVSMYQLLSRTGSNNYTLFEQWGDQGNDWYSSVSMLTDVNEDFQIVIEGIRGESFMSDIAIDDVSIQHGENCTKALSEASTPPTILQESCVGRCDYFGEAKTTRGCRCSLVCVVTQNCCPDFLDVCDFDANNYPTIADSSASSGPPPQTQKLIATTTETLPTTSSTTPSTTSTTTIKSTTTTTTTTTTTAKPTTRLTYPTTKLLTTTTTSTTALTSPRSTTARRTTTTRRPTAKPTTTSTPKPVPRKVATTLTVSVIPLTSTTIWYSSTKHEDKMTTDMGKHAKRVAKKTEGISGATITVTVLLVAIAIVGVLSVAYVMSRSSRGVAALARIRGRTTSDPEVHYLKSDVEDD